MKLGLLFVGLLNAVAAAPAPNHAHLDPQTAASLQIDEYQIEADANIIAALLRQPSGSQCTIQNVAYRQEWGTLSSGQREEYIAAVKCLRSLPPRSSPQDVPGARSRYDDFVATHITQTPFVHFSGLFFHWHRYLTWTYEQALRNECGYTGRQPYWDWTLEWQDPSKSTVFDGSATSLGGNGQAIPHGDTNVTAFGITVPVPPGTGGGCVQEGPFANLQVNLGPVNILPPGPDDGLGYNPRCLTRDLGPYWSNHTKPTDVASLLSTTDSFELFHNITEAIDGVHAGGHFTIGAIGDDVAAAIVDPAFFMHHAMIDRVWTIWQNLNPSTRTNQLFGTVTAFNNPPSANVVPSTLLNLGVLNPELPISEANSVIGGNFCYLYV